MKNNLRALAASIAMVSMIACDNGETSETNIDSANAASTTTTDATMDASSSSLPSVTAGTYVDLKTGKEVRLERDDASGYWVDATTRTPVDYYISVDTRDTFDRQGRYLNGALNRQGNNYVVDESRLRLKIDSDGDMKVKDGDETKMKYDKSSDEIKYKDDTSKSKSGGQ